LAWASAAEVCSSTTGTVGSPGLFLADTNSRERAALGTRPEGSPFLRLSDRHGTTRAVVGVTTTYDKTGAEGISPENTLTLIDRKGKVIWRAPKD
jgi:hypothetical protein